MDNDKENQDGESPIQSVDIDMENDDSHQDEQVPAKTVPEEGESAETPAAESYLEEEAEETIEPDGQELFDAYDGDTSMDVPASSPKNKKRSAYIGGVIVVLALVATGYVYFSSSSTTTPSVPDYAAKQATPEAEETAGVAEDGIVPPPPMDFPETGVLNNIDDVSQLVENSASDSNGGDAQNIDFGQPPLPVPMSGDADGQESVQPDQMVDEILDDVANDAEMPPVDESITDIAETPEMPDETIATENQNEEPSAVDIDFSESAEPTESEGGMPLPAPETSENNLPMPDDIESLEQQATVIETQEKLTEVSEEPATNTEVQSVPVPSVTEDAAIDKDKIPQDAGVEAPDTMVENEPKAMTEETTAEVESAPAVVEETASDIEKEASTSSDENEDTVAETQMADERTLEQEIQPNTGTTEAPIAQNEKPDLQPQVTESVPEMKPAKQPVTAKQQSASSQTGWVLRSAQLGVAWVSRVDGSGDLVRIAEGQKHPELGTIKRIAPINGRWIIEGTKGKIEQ